MKVSVKTFAISLDIKNKGIEIDVSDTQGKHLGDLWVTNTELIWCKGRKSRINGERVKWEDFMQMMESNA